MNKSNSRSNPFNTLTWRPTLQSLAHTTVFAQWCYWNIYMKASPNMKSGFRQMRRSVETLVDGHHKKIHLPHVPSIAQAQAPHSAQVHLYRTMITGPRHKHIPRGTTHTVPTAKRLTLTSIPHGHGTAISLCSISQKIYYFTQQITQLAQAIM